MDTIFALASAPGKAGVAVIRISGPLALQAGRDLAGTLPQIRVAGLRKLRDRAGNLLDHGLVFAFEKGHSFTDEDVVELHLHGSRAVVSAVLSELADMPGLRGAEAGEFTRRALENECLDLAQVEGLSDLIEAETEAQRIQAQRVFSGVLGDKVETWRSLLIRAAALLEATIDFADEDVPVDVGPEVSEILTRLLTDLRHEVDGVAVAERIRDGFEVAIVGRPNVGKSTLLNYLAGRDAAITSEIAGTTRDIVEVRMDLRGLPVTFLDTAGMRETSDAIEKIGVERTVARAEAADLRVFLVDSKGDDLGVNPRPDDIVVLAKSDTHEKSGVSGRTGDGVAELVDRVSAVLQERSALAGDAIRDRHRVAIGKSLGFIEEARLRLDTGQEFTELAAEELRCAIRALDSLVGRVDVENLLDEIFLRFCIGK